MALSIILYYLKKRFLWLEYFFKESNQKQQTEIPLAVLRGEWQTVSGKRCQYLSKNQTKCKYKNVRYEILEKHFSVKYFTIDCAKSLVRSEMYFDALTLA